MNQQERKELEASIAQAERLANEAGKKVAQLQQPKSGKESKRAQKRRLSKLSDAQVIFDMLCSRITRLQDERMESGDDEDEDEE